MNVLKDEVRRLHKDLVQVRTELKLERARALDLTYALQEKGEELENHRRDYDLEMKDIISKLLLLEADFRKEKEDITRLLAAKDLTIDSLNNEVSSKNNLIESLRSKVESLQRSPDKDDRHKLERKMEAQKHEYFFKRYERGLFHVDNMGQYLNLKSCHLYVLRQPKPAETHTVESRFFESPMEMEFGSKNRRRGIESHLI